MRSKETRQEPSCRLFFTLRDHALRLLPSSVSADKFSPQINIRIWIYSVPTRSESGRLYTRQTAGEQPVRQECRAYSKQHVAYNHKISMKQINRKGIVADKHHDFRHMLHFGKQVKAQENHACWIQHDIRPLRADHADFTDIWNSDNQRPRSNCGAVHYPAVLVQQR